MPSIRLYEGDPGQLDDILVLDRGQHSSLVQQRLPLAFRISSIFIVGIESLDRDVEAEKN